MKRIFLTGLAVVIPAGLTLYILSFIIDMMDNLLRVIPRIISLITCSVFTSRDWASSLRSFSSSSAVS